MGLFLGAMAFSAAAALGDAALAPEARRWLAWPAAPWLAGASIGTMAAASASRPATL